MSINMQTERVGSLADVARWLPKYQGTKIHTSTLWRWTSRGLRGVRLEYLRLGGRILTSVEAVTRFAAKLNDLDQQQPEDAPPPVQKARKRTPTARDRDVASARRELAAAGIR